MKRIYKYGPLSPEPSVSLSTPVGAQFVHVAVQGSYAYLWALVDPTERRTEIDRFVVLETGWDITPDLVHQGSWLAAPYVWHLFMRKS